MRRISAYGFSVLLAFIVLCCGCSAFESACTKALPTISAAHVYTDDLVDWIADVRLQVANLPLPPDKLAQLNADLEKASAIARAAYDAEALAINACSKPDVSTIFGNIAEVAKDVISIVGMFGAAPGRPAPRVRQPLVVLRLGR